MKIQVSSSSTYTSLKQKTEYLASIISQIQGFFNQSRPAAIPPGVYEGIGQIVLGFEQITSMVEILEDERKNLQSLAQVSNLVNSSLELDDVLQTVMDTIIQISGAERGFLMLKDENDSLEIRVARNFERESIDPADVEISLTVVNRAVNDGIPVLTTNAQEDPRFVGQQSVVAYNLRSIVCVPLAVKGVITGAIYTDNRARAGIFNQKDADLLAAFANQAAVALENARLYESVKNTLSEVTRLKNLMENVFSSVASGVLTIDNESRILMCNRVAESILARDHQEMIGMPIDQILPPIFSELKPHLDQVTRTEQPVTGVELTPFIPSRGTIHLRFSLSPLKDVNDQTQGVAIVLEDQTEKKRLEAQRSLFERMVSPAVIERLNPANLHMGGQRSEISVLFADIRGFTSFSEGLMPEQLVSVLNVYMASAVDAVLEEGGTIDKFLGDAVMCWFNAPVPQADHPLRAVRAALMINALVKELHKSLPPRLHLSYGIGIHTGEALLGLIGTAKRLDFTAVGDTVNTAKRIQENADGGQVLISQQVYQQVARFVEARIVKSVLAKGKREPIIVYEVVRLK